MMIGGTQAFTAVDQNGTPRPDATWSISDTSIANFVEGSANTLTGLAAGQTTITATIGSLSAQAQVTVLSGPLTPGTTLWSAAPIAGFTAGGIVQAVPTANGPDLYSLEFGSGQGTLVRAFKSDGEQLWQHMVGVTANGIGDNNGGLLLAGSPAGGGGEIIDLDGTRGAEKWQESTSGTTPTPAIGADGTVYAVERPCVSNASFTANCLDAFDGGTGALKSRVQLPVQTITDVPSDLCGSDSSSRSTPGGFTNPTIGPDGSVYMEVDSIQWTMDTSNCGADMQETLSLWKDGEVFMTLGSFSGEVEWNPLSAKFGPITTVPDGNGGMLAGFADDTGLTGKFTLTDTGGASATFPSLRSGFVAHGAVLGDNGAVFFTDGNTVASIDAQTLGQNWSFSTGDSLIGLVASTSSGGVAITDSSTGMIQLDASGNAGPPVSGLEHAISIEYAPPLFDPSTGAMFGTWASDVNGTLSAMASVYVPTAVSAWNTPTGNVEGQRSSPKYDLELVWCANFSCSSLYDAEDPPQSDLNLTYPYFQDNPTHNSSPTITLTPQQVEVVQQAALQAFQQAFAAYPNVKVGTGGHGTNTVYVIGTDPRSASCGGTKFQGIRWSNVFWLNVMGQAQFALNLQTGNPAQDLLQAIGTGIGNIAAHETGHQFLTAAQGMDDLTHLDEYNDGSCDGSNSSWFFTGQSGGVSIHWDPESVQTLQKLFH